MEMKQIVGTLEQIESDNILSRHANNPNYGITAAKFKILMLLCSL